MPLYTYAELKKDFRKDDLVAHVMAIQTDKLIAPDLQKRLDVSEKEARNLDAQTRALRDQRIAAEKAQQEAVNNLSNERILNKQGIADLKQMILNLRLDIARMEGSAGIDPKPAVFNQEIDAYGTRGQLEHTTPDRSWLDA